MANISDVLLVNEHGEEKTVQERFVSDCEKLGWKRAEKPDKNEDFDRVAALALLKEKGVNVHPNTGVDKLMALLEEHSA